MQAQFVTGDPRMVPYTPSGADVAAGQVVQVGDSLFIAHKKILDGVEGDLAAYGGIYKVTAGEAIAAGKKVYWDDSANKVVETATTGKLLGFLLPGESAADDGDVVKVVHLPDMAASTPAAVVAALTDNGGGTADGTVASQAAPTTLTNSTGLTPDNTLAAPSVPADITGGESPTEAEHNAALAAMRIVSQNVADVGGKVIELVTLATTSQNNLKEVTTTLASILTSLKNAGLMKTA